MRCPSFILRLLLLSGVAAPPLIATPPTNLSDGLYAEIETPRGTLVARLAYEEAPLTVANFVGLAEGMLGPRPGVPFYDGLTFHRVVPDFVVQGGDPLGTGEGGPGYEFPDELTPALRHDDAGILSMANSGPDTNGSQFFITLTATRRLDYLHSVFGELIEGFDVLPQIAQGDAMTVRIHRVGTAAAAFRADQVTVDALAAAAPRARPPHLDDPDALLPTTPPWSRILGHKLANFERFTGAKLFVRLQAARETADESARPGTLARRYAARCGVREDGMVMIHFAESDEWALWIGDRQLPRFNPEGKSLHDAKVDFVTRARTQAEAAIAARYPHPDEPAPADQRLKRQLDALIEAAFTVLEPVEESVRP